MSQYLKNLDIISKRFPEIYLHLLFFNKSKHKTRSYNNSSIPNPDLESSEIVFVYKCPFNDFHDLFKTWVVKPKKKLIFIEDNLHDLYKFLHLKTAYLFLKNKNVHLYYVENLKTSIEEITAATTSSKIEVITFYKQTQKFKKFKNEILQNALISYFANHDRIYSFKIFKNFYSNIEKLQSSFLINKLKNSFKDKPAIICGAGPSLKYSFETLKRLENKALIIAGGSAITCLTQQNIQPHIGAIIDPNFEEYSRLADSFAFEVPMMYSTRVNKGVFNTFNGPLGYIKARICGFFEVYAEHELKIPGKYLKARLAEKALSITTVCLMVAKYLGCNPIILDGIDLAYSENQHYALNIVKDNECKKGKKEIGDAPIFAKDKNDREICTNLKWEIERDWISHFVKLHKEIDFINVTKSGLKIENAQDMSLDEVEKKYLSKQFDIRGLMHSLSSQNMLSHIKDTGIEKAKLKLKNSFLKCKDLLEDIYKNDPAYKAILAKEELPKEEAYSYFLFDLDYTLHKFPKNSNKIKKLKQAVKFFLRVMKIQA